MDFSRKVFSSSHRRSRIFCKLILSDGRVGPRKDSLTSSLTPSGELLGTMAASTSSKQVILLNIHNNLYTVGIYGVNYNRICLSRG